MRSQISLNTSRIFKRTVKTKS